MAHADAVFAGSVPRLYETHLVPLIFQPYAIDIGRRVGSLRVERLLEIAAGTGVVTRVLAATLGEGADIVATDLNQAMLDEAATYPMPRPVEWRQADAMSLPFRDAEFDAVVCQFGVMFFPDKAKAFAEARRVLRPGGTFLFNVWDRIEHNEFAECVTTALKSIFPADPPRFLARTPHGHHDLASLARDLESAGFSEPMQAVTVTERSVASSARIPAVAYCQGTPLRNEIEARDASRLAEATSFATAALARRFGDGAVDGKIQAHVVMIEA